MNIPDILLFQQRLLFQLSVWSLLSVFAGGITVALTPTGSFWQAFGGMNAAWGLVNLVIASLGFYGVMRKIRSGLCDEREERARLLRLLKLNALLDIGYVAAGVGMVLWGKTPLLQGFGWGIIVQGGFLLLFDAWHYQRGGSA